MINYRPIFLAIGILLSVLSVAMLIPATFDYAAHNQEYVSFFISSFLTAFVGISLFLTNRGHTNSINIRQAFILTSGSWTVLVAFAALPLYFSNQDLSYTDAFFEAMSGLTSTGSTILTGLDNMPPGILLWRSLLQWMGGIGIIVVALAILPMLNIGGMQLFKTESSDKSDKILPRTAQLSFAISSVYLAITLMCTISLIMAGMSNFDAINHAMSTVSTGGLSTHDQSVAYFNNVKIEIVIIIFMLAGGIPFTLYISMIQGNLKSLTNNTQVRCFFAIVLITVLAVAIELHLIKDYDVLTSIRYALFNIVSVITTTGFSSANYSEWGTFSVTLILMLLVVGGCTGSTTGGIKIFRFQVLYQTAKAQIDHLIHPHAVIRPRFNGKPITDDISSSVMSFTTLYIFSLVVVSVLLSMCGLDYLTSMSAAAANQANLGVGLGSVVGPAGNFSSLPDMAKWILSFAMLLGRLEIFTILVLFAPSFWKN